MTTLALRSTLARMGDELIPWKPFLCVTRLGFLTREVSQHSVVDSLITLVSPIEFAHLPYSASSSILRLPSACLFSV